MAMFSTPSLREPSHRAPKPLSPRATCRTHPPVPRTSTRRQSLRPPSSHRPTEPSRCAQSARRVALLTPLCCSTPATPPPPLRPAAAQRSRAHDPRLRLRPQPPAPSCPHIPSDSAPSAAESPLESRRARRAPLHVNIGPRPRCHQQQQPPHHHGYGHRRYSPQQEAAALV